VVDIYQVGGDGTHISPPHKETGRASYLH